MTPTINSYSAKTKIQYSTWLWETTRILKEDYSILNFLKNNNVKNLYLQVNQDLKQQDYAVFISKANQFGILVYALEGSPFWINCSNNDHLLFLNWVTKYQNSVERNQKFAGIHLDVEPYLHSSWKSDYQKIVKIYQDIIIETGFKAKELMIPFVVDIPFWFDEQKFQNSYYGDGTLSDWVIRNVDGIDIMAYRNVAYGNNGIIRVCANEIIYANNVGKTVSIGVETQNLPKQSYLTFYSKGKHEMQDTLDEVQEHYKNDSSFIGFSIHSYCSWRELR
jgi:hypothetical protein